MNIEIIFVVLLVGFFYVRYLAFTMQIAIAQRDKMVKPINKILENDEYSSPFKQMVVILFHLSLKRNFLPKMVLNIIISGLFPNRRNKSPEHNFMQSLNKEERREFFNLIKKHALVVNAGLSPHWYFLVALLLFVMFFTASIFRAVTIGKAKLRTKIESSVASIVCKDDYCH